MVFLWYLLIFNIKLNNHTFDSLLNKQIRIYIKKVCFYSVLIISSSQSVKPKNCP